MEAVRIHLEQYKCFKDEYEAPMIALREVQWAYYPTTPTLY